MRSELLIIRSCRSNQLALAIALCLTGLVGLSLPTHASGCRLALALALDVSSSIDEEEYNFQREGLARALSDPEIIRAFLRAPPVALFVFEWSSASVQKPLISDWVVVDSRDVLADVAKAMRDAPKTERSGGTTGLGSSLAYAGRKLGSAPRCLAQTIDVSGDGRNNSGITPAEAFADPQFDSVTVNALVVEGAQNNAALYGSDVGLVQWFRQNVVRGPGAFLVVASEYSDYQRAMKAKLLRELESVTISELTPDD